MKSDSIQGYLTSIKDVQAADDAQTLIEIMQRISGHEPKIWDMGTLGFDSYHYKYDSGREGDTFVLGFRPSKAKLTLYLMDGTARYPELLKKLGKHKTTGYCVYIKKLSDIDIDVLRQLLQESYDHIKSLNGNVTQILWKAD